LQKAVLIIGLTLIIQRTHKIARAVDEKHRVSDVVSVAGRILEHEDGVIGKVVLVEVGDGKHNIVCCWLRSAHYRTVKCSSSCRSCRSGAPAAAAATATSYVTMSLQGIKRPLSAADLLYMTHDDVVLLRRLRSNVHPRVDYFTAFG